MGIFGGMLTVPVNAILAYYLKRDELTFQHKLDLILRKRELLWEHQLEMERLRTRDTHTTNEKV